ncbi:Cysteine-rich secretory protein LCCL domain-containing 2 [Holothuria leucospilota]|uniref:Cysteine-rich secretory protein LCCL domain-containing 2 n=1 Tax=Holothuria leucospilota TaxID=206669 RepID=A0A9Q1HDR6_HOLLE|nr:Cysteine-rich secretory protein LCCL domain-containing 2 [Holothuria leucospilota]
MDRTSLPRWVCLLLLALLSFLTVQCEEIGLLSKNDQIRLKREIRRSVAEDLQNLQVLPRQRTLTLSTGSGRDDTALVNAEEDEGGIHEYPVWNSVYPWWLDYLNITDDIGGQPASSTSLQLEEAPSSSISQYNGPRLDSSHDDELFGEEGDLEDGFFDLGRTLAASRTGSISKYLYKKKKNKMKKKKNRNYLKAYVPLKSSHKNTLLRMHNRFRKEAPGPASNMEKMKWDSNLEIMARRYAKKCRWEHGQVTNLSPYEHVGQNLAYGIGREFTPFYLTRLWYKELLDYDVLTGYCTPGKPCGHYTQLAWANTKYVGCEANFCKSLYDPNRDRRIKNAVYLVCNYGPGGNYAGEAPYKIGAPCTECSSWSGKCENGLCSDCDLSSEFCECAIQCHNGGTLDTTTCRCQCAPGWTGPECKTVCNNTHPYCGDGWPRQWCFKDNDDNPVEDLCPALCGVCECGGPPCSNGGTKDPSSCECECVEPWQGSDCTECNLQCDHGDLNTRTCSCECHDGWMGDTCSETCGNSHQLCYNGWYINWCDEEHPYVLQYCQAMCGLCEIQPEEADESDPTEPCEDAFVHCKWSKSFCSTNPDFARNFCPFTCDLCSPQEGNDV